MPIDEIEIPGTSASFRCLSFKADSIDGLYKSIQKEGDAFSIDPEVAGFHECETDKKLIRGFFSTVVPFEVEHLVDGIVTKTLFKRIESCEFFVLDNVAFVTGKTVPQKILERALAGLSGYGAAAMEFEFKQMSALQDRLSLVKAIVLTNPKTNEIRRARLAGKIESYTDYNVIDPKSHGIESVSGIIDSPLGPITLTTSRKGGLRLGVKRGFILTIECLLWLLALVREEHAPQRNLPID